MIHCHHVHKKEGVKMLENIFVHYLDMPTSVKSNVTHNEDGSYSIFINARLSQNQQANAYMHELEHILKDDFNRRHETADRLEYYAHRLIG